MIKKLGLIKDEEEEELFDWTQQLTKLMPREEYRFRKNYKEMAVKMGLSLNPNDPEHYYDYRGLWKETGKLEPDETGHFPSKYKLEGHPNMYVEGVKTKEEEKPGWKQRIRGVGGPPKYEIPKTLGVGIKGKVGLGAGIEEGIGIKLPEKPELEEDIFKPPEIKKLGLIKDVEESKSDKPEDDILSNLLSSMERYKKQIDELEELAKERSFVEVELRTYRYSIGQYNKAVKRYNEILETRRKPVEMPPLIEGLPISKPEDKPESLLEEAKKGIIGIFGTWEAKKKVMPELQKMEDLANFLPKVPNLPNFENQNMSQDKSIIAYLHSLITDTPLPVTIKKMQSNIEKFGEFNPDIDERTWKEYYKEEGLLKTLITGPNKGEYDEAIKLQQYLYDILMRVAEPGKDFIGQLGWAGMAIIMGYQGITALYKGGMVIENRIIKGEKLKQAVKRIQNAYIKETDKFKSSLSNNDFRIAQSLNQTLKQYGKGIFPLQSMEVPQEVFMGQAGNINNLVKMIQGAEKVTPKIASQLKALSPADVSQVIQNLSIASPAIASKLAPELVKLIPEEKPEVITDPARIQEIENSIAEGELILKTGKSEGRKFSADELTMVQRSVDSAKRKIGLVVPAEKVEEVLERVREPITKEEIPKVEPTEVAVPEVLEKQSIFLYDKPFSELKKSELNKVLEETKQPLPDEAGKYVNKIGTPAKGIELRPMADEHARFIFGGYEKGLLTDSHLLVFDKDVSKKVLDDLIEKYKKAKVKEVQTAEISYKEAQKIVDKEVEGYKKEYVKQFPDTEKILPKDAIEKSIPLWIQGHQVTDYGPPITIFTDGKIQVALDTNKISFLNKHFPNAEIKSTGQDKPVLFMEEGKLKAVVMPIRMEEYPFKITGEPTIRKLIEKVEPTIKKVRPTIRPTKPKTYDLKADLTPEQRIEGNKLIGRIQAIVHSKGLTKKEFISLKQKYGLSPHLATDTRRMTMPQLQAVLKAVERVRPKRIGYQKVITKKTEGKIQSLKDSLIEKYQMTGKAYEDTLKDLGIYKEPAYIDAKHFITEEQGKDIIYRLIDEAEILKITEPLRIALEKNPEVKKVADVIDRRVKSEGERTLKDPSDLNSARSYFQILETISGAPFFTLYQDLINCHLENRADLNHLIEGFNEYRDIIKDEKELKKVEDWILAKSDLRGKPESPVNITPKEIELAKKIEKILKDYQSRARTEKFLDNLEHPEAMPDYIKYKKEIDKAKDIYESKGYDDLVKYMKDQKFGIIESGYDPIQVVSAKVRKAFKAKGLSIVFGKEHIKVRKDIEYKEQETNIITRVISYKRQMDNLSVMAPKVRALITLANKNLSKFKDPKRVRSNLGIFFRELKGYDRSAGWFERGINRLYAQAMTTIIMGSPPLAFRNLGQNLGLGHDKAMLVDPRNKKLTPDEIVFLDTYVQQAIFMRTDWFMTGEKALGFRFKIGKVQMQVGLERLTDLIKKINLYPRSDVANRHWGFWGKINQVRMAFEDKTISLKKKTEKAKFSDFSLLEQKRALQILAKDGQKAMEKYVSRCYVDDVHFLYERAQRSLAEMGPYGKVFGNLMLFPRAYWEKLTKMSKKMTGKYVPAGERARAFKVIASILIGGALVGVAYTKTTGRRKPPYDPLVLLAYQTGGLMIGTVEALNDVYVETINAVRGDRRALAGLTSSVPALADHLIPFYNYMLRGYEAFLGDPLVNKNIDVYALKKLRQLVDKEYEIRGGVHSVERNALEKWQYFLSGAGVDVAIAERKKREREAEPIIIGKPKIPRLGIPKIGKPGIKKISPIKKF